jgi:hypothetical protein
MLKDAREGVRWSDFALWRDDLCRVWGKSVVVTMTSCAPGRAQFYRDCWTVWLTPLCGRLPDQNDPKEVGYWPSEQYASVPALLISLIIRLDRQLVELEAERRTQTEF